MQTKKNNAHKTIKTKIKTLPKIKENKSLARGQLQQGNKELFFGAY